MFFFLFSFFFGYQASPLLSRFDLVLVLLDTRNENWDRIVSSFILEQRDQPGMGQDGGADAEQLWSLEKLQGYVAYIKTLAPKLGPESSQVWKLGRSVGPFGPFFNRFFSFFMVLSQLFIDL